MKKLWVGIVLCVAAGLVFADTTLFDSVHVQHTMQVDGAATVADFSLLPAQTPATLSTVVNNYTPTNWSAFSQWHLTGAVGGSTITGLAALSTDRWRLLSNLGTTNITLTDHDSRSAAANQLALTAAFRVIAPGGAVLLRYDTSTTKWIVISFSSVSSTTQVNVTQYGAKCDGSTDDSAAFNAALAAVNAAGGGVVVFPAATCLIASQIVLPNDGAPIPNQNAIRIAGASAFSSGRGTGPGGGTILVMTSTAGTGGKLSSFGVGKLEIDHLTIQENTGTTTTPMIYVTNTTLHLHDVTGYGANTGTACNQDFLVLGGTATTSDGTANSPFQGYGTVVENNYINRLRRFAFLQTFANQITIRDNTIWSGSGSNLVNGAAIELVGVVSNTDGGNTIEGNLIEVSNYPYAFRLTFASENTFVSNGTYDPTVTTLAYYRIESTATRNTIVQGFGPDSVPFLSDAASGANTAITSHQNQTSTLPEPWNFTNNSTSFNGFQSSNVSTWSAAGLSAPIVLKNTTATTQCELDVEGSNGANGISRFRQDTGGNTQVISDSGSVKLSATAANKTVSADVAGKVNAMQITTDGTTVLQADSTAIYAFQTQTNFGGVYLGIGTSTAPGYDNLGNGWDVNNTCSCEGLGGGTGSVAPNVGLQMCAGAFHVGKQALFSCATPTASAGTLAAWSTNGVGRLTGIGATTTTLTFGGGGFATDAGCLVTLEGTTPQFVTVSQSRTAPVINCFAATTGTAANCANLTYHCWGN